MLRVLRTGQRWLTALLIAGIGTVFVVFLGLQGPSKFVAEREVVKVGPFEFGHRLQPLGHAGIGFGERRQRMVDEQIRRRFEAVFAALHKD